jgi:segregation and condensation protein B
LNSAKKESSTSFSPTPTPLLTSASASLPDQYVAKPRRPRVKAEPKIIEKLVYKNRKSYRLPQRYSAQLRVGIEQQLSLPFSTVDSAHQRKPRRITYRLPKQFRDRLAAHSVALPEQRAAPRRLALRFPQRWSARLRRGREDVTLIPIAQLINRESDVNTKRIVEAILFAANKPMTVKQIQQTFPELEQPDTLEIQTALESIAEDYRDRPIGLKQLASGYRFQVKSGFSPWVSRLFEEKPPRYSRALLETLAIIAYRQPVTRGDIEDIRGVSVSTGIMQTLLEREWIRVIAHKEVPGRPALYGTTKQLLDYFNLSSLSELPTLAEVMDMPFGRHTEQESRDDTQTPIQSVPVEVDAENQLQATEQEQSDEQIGQSHTLH